MSHIIRAHIITFLFISVIIIASVSRVSGQGGKNDSEHNFDCGQIYTKKQFVLESPRYPSNYPLNYQCSYLIKGPTCPTYFNLQFIEFNLEDSLGCSKDRLEIDDQDALCGSKTGNKSYFAEKGALVLKLVSDKNNSARGYRILITRSACDPKSEKTTQKPDWYTPNNDAEYTTKRTLLVTTARPKRLNHCCPRVYNYKQFTVTSPNFPYSLNSATKCQIEIHKTHADVCRLRLHVRFFYFGPPSNNCPEGYLEIDGRYFCGCATDLKLISPFQGNSPKIIKFVSNGLLRNSYSGFVIDIIQDECPKRYIPENIGATNNETFSTNFKYYNDQINRVSWPSNHSSDTDTVVERLKLINENTEVISDDEERTPRVIKHVYFFAQPDFDYKNNRRDREETDYIDTSSMTNLIFTNPSDYGSCLYFNQKQFQQLPQNLEICKTSSEGNAISRDCVDLSHERGYFKSPGYPYYYPRNLNICYRFKKLPGYCSIKVYMNDFQIENSVNCMKDYLEFSRYGRYCGNLLFNTVLTFDLSTKAYEDVNFVTDAFHCGRGFSGTYEQIACQDMTFPINPSRPPSFVPTRPCQGTVQDARFTLEVFDYSAPTCRFTIKKSSKLVCKVELYFEHFDLVCASESIVLDGTMYCGLLTGQTITIDVQYKDAILIYKRISNAGIAGNRFRIRGVQLQDCPYPEVPAERIFSNAAQDLNLSKETEVEEDAKYLIKLINNKFKDVCGVVTNSSEVSLPETFCDLLMKNDTITQCLPLRENLIYVPLDSRKLQLKIKDVEKVEEVQFNEVDCDNL